MTLTPGMRTHLGNDWYFLGQAGLPTPATTQRLGGIGMIFWRFMKAWQLIRAEPPPAKRTC